MLKTSNHFQRRQHVLDDVVGMLEPYRKAYQAVADTEFGALRRSQPLMRRRRRMRDEALGVAEIIADANELERILEAERGVLAALDVEGDEGGAAAHLFLRDFGLRVVWPAWI